MTDLHLPVPYHVSPSRRLPSFAGSAPAYRYLRETCCSAMVAGLYVLVGSEVASLSPLHALHAMPSYLRGEPDHLERSFIGAISVTREKFYSVDSSTE